MPRRSKPIAAKVLDVDVPVRTLADARAAKQRRGLKQQQQQHRSLHQNAEAAPNLTTDRASEMALILLAGVPPDRALSYFAPTWAATVTRPILLARVKLWMNDPKLLTAMNETNGGSWHTLPPEKRLRLAADKSLAERAYYLYSHNFNTAYGPDLEKSNDAYKMLAAYLDDHGDNAGSAWQVMLTDIVTAVRTGKHIDGVPDLPILGTPQIQH